MTGPSYWYSDKIVLVDEPRTSGRQGQRAAPRPQRRGPRDRRRHARPRCYVIDDPAPNAFATGRNPEHAALAVTTGLMEKLDRLELEGVVAHEMAHIKNYDTLVQTLAAVMAGTIVLLSDWMLRSLFWGGGAQAAATVAASVRYSR